MSESLNEVYHRMNEAKANQNAVQARADNRYIIILMVLITVPFVFGFGLGGLCIWIQQALTP